MPSIENFDSLRKLVFQGYKDLKAEKESPKSRAAQAKISIFERIISHQKTQIQFGSARTALPDEVVDALSVLTNIAWQGYDLGSVSRIMKKEIIPMTRRIDQTLWDDSKSIDDFLAALVVSQKSGQ